MIISWFLLCTSFQLRSFCWPVRLKNIPGSLIGSFSLPKGDINAQILEYCDPVFRRCPTTSIINCTVMNWRMRLRA
ncbi:hypothetical protein BJ165DRAFT_881564 [Panaeolus papilionaceus]|nr:hypothetical protein BJ165DRAFT_881564 [Panaeolus papilionaceus]